MARLEVAPAITWDGLMSETVAHLLSAYVTLEDLRRAPAQPPVVRELCVVASKGIAVALDALDENSFRTSALRLASASSSDILLAPPSWREIVSI